jgi:exodeoxyribonuclease VII large subunit
LQSPKTKQPLHPVLTVSQLTGQIKDVVEELFDNVYVVGEVSNAKAYPSGHWYFSLKDKEATLPCVCFKSANANIKFKLEDGLMLVAQGRLSVFPPKGGYQLVASALEPVGIGEWQLAFEQLRAALEKEGLLDPARKKAIPTIPKRIGVVTSPAAAALRDILSALSRRNKNVNVVIAPTRVQGEGSAEEIAQAIRDLQNVPGIDVIIVARGGGSIEDLWSFNTEVVARAVAACSIPIVSGVGHETDTTICDLVADLRAPTPTAAAELVAKGSQELLDKYKNLEQKLVFKIEQRLSKARRQLERLSPINALTRYQGRLKQYQMKVAHHRTSIERSVLHLVKNLQNRWQQKHVKLLALAPTNILNRGFAILRKLDGTVVCDPSNVKPGEELQAILKTGSLYLQVAAVQESLFAMLDPRGVSSDDSPDSQLAEAPIPDEDAPIQGLLFDLTATIQASTEAVLIEEVATIGVVSSEVVTNQLGAGDQVNDEPADDQIFDEQTNDDQIIDDQVNIDSTDEIIAPASALEFRDSEDMFVSEALDSPVILEMVEVEKVFDQELANPAVLASIFGEDMADAASASVIFKAASNIERLEFDALNAELTKYDVPPLVAIEKTITVAPVETMELLTETIDSDSEQTRAVYAAEGADKNDGFAPGTLTVEESTSTLNALFEERALVSAIPAASNPRQRPVENKNVKRGGKVAAHQLNLFRSTDDD